MKEKRKCLCVILWKPKSGAPECQILLLKMRPERGGHWQPVTGHVEEGEDFLEAALREAKEESDFSFDRQPQFLGMDYRFAGRFGPVRERAYALWIYGKNPPTPKLDPNEHVAYEWVTPDEALKRVYYPSNKEAITRASRPSSPFLLSSRGVWHQEGEEITHGRTVELLHQSLAATDGGYIVRMGQEEAEAMVEDAPRFVQSYDAANGEIFLYGGFREPLRPETLQIGARNILYCTLENGWKAKFLSPAYYTITKDMRENSGSAGKYLFHFRGRDYEIPIPSKSEGVDS